MNMVWIDDIIDDELGTYLCRLSGKKSGDAGWRGFSVSVRADVGTVIASLRQEVPDVVVIDLKLNEDADGEEWIGEAAFNGMRPLSGYCSTGTGRCYF